MGMTMHMCSHLNRDLKLEPVSRHAVAIHSATLLRFQIANYAELLHQNQSPKFMIVSARQDPNGQKLRAFVTKERRKAPSFRAGKDSANGGAVTSFT